MAGFCSASERMAGYSADWRSRDSAVAEHRLRDEVRYRSVAKCTRMAPANHACSLASARGVSDGSRHRRVLAPMSGVSPAQSRTSVDAGDRDLTQLPMMVSLNTGLRRGHFGVRPSESPAQSWVVKRSALECREATIIGTSVVVWRPTAYACGSEEGDKPPLDSARTIEDFAVPDSQSWLTTRGGRLWPRDSPVGVAVPLPAVAAPVRTLDLVGEVRVHRGAPRAAGHAAGAHRRAL